jgi:hypothetical protein
MPKKESPKMIDKSILNATREAVETAIELSKEGLQATWEGRVKKLASIERWEEAASNQAACNH